VQTGGVRLRWYKTLWGAVGAGAPHATFAEAVPAIAAEGWDGVAHAMIAEQYEPSIGSLPELADRCAEHGLGLAVMVHTWGKTLATHLDELDAVLRRSAAVRPHHIICQGGLDSFGPADRTHFLRESLAREAELGVPIAHETHRHRPLFTPWATRDVLAEFPDLQLVIDLSHWVVVAERLLDDEDDIIRACARRAIHLDARIGYEEGPQVPDPSDPAWKDQRRAFDRWWQLIVAEAAATGRDELVVVPEYGAPPYLHTVPHRGDPVADLWTVCRAERDRLVPLLTNDG
jgi:hypothetical protein